MIYINRKATSYLLILSVFIVIFGSTRTIRAAENNKFKTLQKQLVADGFDQNNINDLYNHSRVSFDVKGVSRFFRHTEAKLNYDQFTSRKSIRKARKYMDHHKTELLMPNAAMASTKRSSLPLFWLKQGSEPESEEAPC